MKVDFHYHFYSRIAISLMIFALGFFLLQLGVGSRAIITNTYTSGQPVVGWAWNDKMGWIALSCLNDFTGDGKLDGYIDSNGAGQGSCANPSLGAWGLRLASVNNKYYVQGCAWAGGTTVSDLETSDPELQTTPGWICFSKPENSSILAPTNGVSISSAGSTTEVCECRMALGTCAGPINHGLECGNYSICSDINYNHNDNYCETALASPVCHNSRTACTNDKDCEFACVNNSLPEFLLKGVCFDHSIAEENILKAHRGDTPPFDDITAEDSSMTTCYIDHDSTNSGYGCVDGSECVYPQAGQPAPVLGNGQCMDGSVSPAVPENPARTCVYDFDCRDASHPLSYCSLSIPNSFWQIPDRCDSAQCTGAYEPITMIRNSTLYPNALNPNGNDPSGFASILKLENVVAQPWYDSANRLGFPLPDGLKVRTGVYTGADYDADMPNDNAGNPIRGCFNCYREKIYQCTSGAVCDCNDQNKNSCYASNCGGVVNVNNCFVDRVVPLCDNCQEYFYYKPGDFLNGASSGRVCEAEPHTACDDNLDCSSNGSIACGAEIKKVGDLKKVLAGFNCSQCTIDNLNTSCTLNSSATNNNRCQRCDSEMFYHTTGVIIDNQHGRSSTSTLCGLGYNAWLSSETNFRGLGWFSFSPRITTSTKPYFSVESGNIYSRGRIVTRYQPPMTKYNASYLIESGGSIINFVSESTKIEKFQGELSDRPLVSYLNKDINFNTTKYTNALGRLDYRGLVNIEKTVNGISYNKYNAEVIEFLGGNLTTDSGNGQSLSQYFTVPLGGRVLHVLSNDGEPSSNTSLTINPPIPSQPASPWTIEPASGQDSGAGMVVVDGNLTINSNIEYLSGNLENIKNIPSLVWIVRGDLKIGPNVTNVVGTFIVLGGVDNNTQCIYNSDLTGDARYGAEGCGKFYSVHPINQASDERLVISGNVLARRFVLLRTYHDDSGLPAEQFINDGRLQVNPPPGLTDMSKVIPRFTAY